MISPALRNEILRGLVGSTAHGLHHEGQDDRDEMGVFIEPPEYVCGLRVLDHYVHRTKPEGVRSGPGDLDLVLYSLRKFCRLAAQGNPTVLVLMHLPQYITILPLGSDLVAMREAFVSKEAGVRFLGYLVSQRMKLTGEKSKRVSRPELVEAHGYDTKFAMHALRLGFEGLEYLRFGRVTLPVAEPNRTTLRAIRAGDVSFPDALALIDATAERLRGAVNECERVADRDAINRFLVRAHREYWPAAA